MAAAAPRELFRLLILCVAALAMCPGVSERSLLTSSRLLQGRHGQVCLESVAAAADQACIAGRHLQAWPHLGGYCPPAGANAKQWCSSDGRHWRVVWLDARYAAALLELFKLLWADSLMHHLMLCRGNLG